MPVEITAEIEMSGVENMLNRIAAKGSRPPLRRLSVVGVKSVNKNFRDSGRPEKWKPLAAVSKKKDSAGKMRDSGGRFTKKQKHRRSGGKPLQDTSSLQKSVHADHLGLSNVKISTQHPYAAHHQFGTGTFGKKGTPYWIAPKGKKALHFITSGGAPAFSLGHFHPGIPARPFIGWQPEDGKEIQKILGDHLMNLGGIL